MPATSPHAPPGAPATSPDPIRVRRQGLGIGSVSVLFWSFASSLIFLGARQAGTWTFVAIASLIGGAAQLIGWRIYRGELRSAVCLRFEPVVKFVVGHAASFTVARSG